VEGDQARSDSVESATTAGIRPAGAPGARDEGATGTGPAADDAASTVAAEEKPAAVETVEGQQFNPNLRGRLEEASATRVRGWVADKFEPDSKMVVAVFIDEAPAFQVAASRREDNKNEGVIWRFEHESPDALKDGQKHIIRAYVLRPHQHGRTELAWSPRTLNGGSFVRGKLEAASAEKGISGYAWDPDSNSRAVKIIISIDGAPVGKATANGKNAELKARGIAPQENCAFKADWPKALDDGEEHTLQVFAVDNEAGTEHEIEGSPRVISGRSGASGSPPVGGFDICNRVALAGWAWDPDVAGACDIEVWIDGEMFQRMAASSKRDQLKSARITPDAYHGWVLNTPGKLLDGATHTVRAYALNHPEGIKVELSGSPKYYRVEENTTPMGGFWHADEKWLHGWAADPDLGANPCEIEIYIDGKLWQRLKAEAREEWLVGSGLAPDAMHGFHVKPPDFATDGKEHTVQIFAVNHPEGPAANLGTRTIGVNSIFPGFWTQDKLLDTRIEKGLYVTGVSPWFDAYHKGVKTGDVLLEYAGIVAGTAEVKDKEGKVTTPGTMTADLRKWLNANRKNGEMLKLKLWRDGSTYEVEVKVGELKGQ
jgi:hypothetical protein